MADPGGHSEANDAQDQARSVDIENYEFTFSAPSATGQTGLIEPDAPFNRNEVSESLSESVQNFPEEFGRTYHAYRAGSYAFPNDIPERERLALQNEALVKVFGNKLYFSPLSQDSPPRYILDIATGLGDWAIEMGDLFPTSQVMGTDLSPIQPRQVPPNVNFYVEDSSDPWEYSHKFDFIHTRVTGGCWSSFEKQVAQQAFDALEPGGYFESQEFDCFLGCDDGTLDREGPYARWVDDMRNAGSIVDRPLVTGAKLKEIYERTGFVDVQEARFKIPSNGWAKDETLKEVGTLWEQNLAAGLSGLSLSLLNRAYNRSVAEIEVSLVEVRREISDPKIHSWWPVYVVWGRKPTPDEMRG